MPQEEAAWGAEGQQRLDRGLACMQHALNQAGAAGGCFGYASMQAAAQMCVAQDGGADVMPGIRITCESHDAEGLTQEPGLVWSKGANGADKANAAFRIDEGCPSQKLGFILNSSQGRPLAYSVMAIRVERVPTGDARAN